MSKKNFNTFYTGLNPVATIGKDVPQILKTLIHKALTDNEFLCRPPRIAWHRYCHSAHPEMAKQILTLADIFVARKILSSEYRP